MPESPCLHRWKEASGYDSACNNCGSGLSAIGSGVGGTGGPAWTAGVSTGSHGKDRKNRDVSKKEGMSTKQHLTSYKQNWIIFMKTKALLNATSLLSSFLSCHMGRRCHSWPHAHCREADRLTHFHARTMIIKINILMAS